SSLRCGFPRLCVDDYGEHFTDVPQAQGPTFYGLITNRSAASTARSSSKLRCPTRSPIRLGSTAAVCSVRTRVSVPSIWMLGRKVAGRAEVDVGATSQVDRARRPSDCTTTA